MAKNKLTSPKFNQAELICGWCWWAFQFFLLPSLLHAVNELLPNPLSQAELNFTYFLLNFLAVILIFHRFLRKSFDAAAAHPAYFCQAVILGLVFYLVMSRVINWCILKLDPAFQNANDAFISGLHRSSGYLTVLGTVLLAPIAEECFYRGLFFGTFARKNLWVTPYPCCCFPQFTFWATLGRLPHLRWFCPSCNIFPPDCVWHGAMQSLKPSLPPL